MDILLISVLMQLALHTRCGYHYLHLATSFSRSQRQIVYIMMMYFVLYTYFVQPFCLKALRYYMHGFALGFAPFCTLLNTLSAFYQWYIELNTVTYSIFHRPARVMSILQLFTFRYFCGSSETTKILNLEIIKLELFQSRKKWIYGTHIL